CWMMRSWALPSSRSALSSAAFTRRGPGRRGFWRRASRTTSWPRRPWQCC
ncbi:unnamed protein product, partial [Effrenium voratum]